ncbi:MAG: DUF6314 family protein [Longimicrobiales bacterium]
MTGMVVRRNDASATQALSRIARVRRVGIRVRDERATTSGCGPHAISGTAVVDAIRKGHRVTWLEAGGWGNVEPLLRPAPTRAHSSSAANTDLAGIRFRNELRWTQLGPVMLLLERPRPGPARESRFGDALDGSLAPVRILLTPDATGAWISASAHVCGHDIYTARLELRDDGMSLVWIVRGPRKDQVIACTYTP